MRKLHVPVLQKHLVTEDEAVVQLLMDDSFITKAAACVRGAKRRVWICAYTWRWYENSPEREIQRFNNLVARHARAGLDVRAILHQPSQAQFLQTIGMATRYLPTDRVMHTKAILVDDSFLILGSHNLTERGTAENYEASILVNSAEPCIEFADYFEHVWMNFAVAPK